MIKILSLTVLGFACCCNAVLAQESEQERSIEVPIQSHIESNDDVLERSCWIGCETQAVSPVIKSQMGLKYGLAILGVANGSPAERAGLRECDIILQFDHTVIETGQELSDVVDQCATRTTQVDLIREGRLVRVKIKPEFRPVCKQVVCVVVSNGRGQFELGKARAQIAREMQMARENNHECRFVVYALNPFIIEESDFQEEQGRMETLASVEQSQCRPRCKTQQGLEFMRLKSDLQAQLDKLEDLQIQMHAESVMIQRDVDYIFRRQNELKKQISRDLNGLCPMECDQVISDIRQGTFETEREFARWQQILDQLAGYHKVVRPIHNK